MNLGQLLRNLGALISEVKFSVNIQPYPLVQRSSQQRQQRLAVHVDCAAGPSYFSQNKSGKFMKKSGITT